MNTEVERIVRQLEKAFEKQPWYGPSVTEVLREADTSVVHKRVGHAHTIIELVLHMTAWRRFVIQRLSGDVKYEVTDELNFPKPSAAADAWSKAIDGLMKSQKEMITAIKQFPEEKLSELVPGASHKYTWYTLLHGIIQHDVYHTGQISLLKRALQ